MPQALNLKALSDDALLRRLSELTQDSRHVEADVVAHIGEADARRLYARHACSSMFDYCRQVLELRENEAYLRITVARASREHPLLLAMLRDGRLHLSGIAKLARHLNPENRDELLGRAAGMSHRQVKELVRELEPLPDSPSTIRKLPEPRAEAPRGPAWTAAVEPQLGAHRVEATAQLVGAPGPEPQSPLAAAGAAAGAGAGAGAGVSGIGTGVRAQLGTRGGASTGPTPPPPARPATMEPTAPGRYRLSLSIQAELRDKLEKLQALMRSTVPDGDLARIVDLAVTEKLERLQARRFAQTKTPRRAPSPNTGPKIGPRLGQPPTRYIPAAVRRAVHERDGGQCTYVDRHGRRCTRRHDLEFHHRKPFARGGEHSPAVLALMCRTHNLLMAEQDYGAELMARYRRGASLGVVPAATIHGPGRAPGPPARSPD